MNNAPIKQTDWDLLYLIACALHGQTPEAERVQTMDFAGIYRAARFHSLTAMTAMALESAKAFRHMPPELAGKWKEDKEKAIRKNLLLDAEREQILGYMESEGIWYMPLKGSILQNLYPKYGMRQMSDNDILYDSSYQNQMLHFMKGRGYQAVIVGKTNHDAYEKPPVYNFELHTALFGAMHNPVWQEYYKNVQDRLMQDTDRSFGYHFRDEDFYIYITTHACKHYDNSGTGLRTLVDTYVYTWKKGAALDWNYIEKELETLEIAGFERQIRLLAEKLFSNPEQFSEISLTEKERVMLAYFSGSGTYGTMKNHIEKNMKVLLPGETSFTAWSKLRYLWKRIFPDSEWFQRYEPFYARHRVFIPFFLVYRIFRGVFFRRKKLKNELCAVRDAGKRNEQ